MCDRVIASLPQDLLRQRMRELRGVQLAVDCPAGFNWCRGLFQPEVVLARRATPAGHWLRLAVGETPSRARFESLPGFVGAVLWLGTGALAGRAAGHLLTPAVGWRSLTHLHLIGPGMHRVRLSNRPAGLVEGPRRAALGDGEAPWSRTRGVLGEAFDRAVALRIGVVGAGRLGGLLIGNLVRFGIQELVLVDPDRIETHNTGEGEYHRSDVGHLKVEALGARISREYPEVRVQPIPRTVCHGEAIRALAGCDFLFSAPDQPAARLAAAWLATSFVRPLIDVGVRIHRGGLFTMGADIRLVLPDCCLLCLGGVRGEEDALATLQSPDAEAASRGPRDWRRERPGSLRSLNGLAAFRALRLFEDFVRESVRESVWYRLQFTADGRLWEEMPEPSARPPLPCACDVMGWGQAALSRLLPVLRNRQEIRATQRELIEDHDHAATR